MFAPLPNDPPPPSRAAVRLGMVLALVAVTTLVGCGGSASETPPPIEPAPHPVMVDESGDAAAVPGTPSGAGGTESVPPPTTAY